MLAGFYGQGRHARARAFEAAEHALDPGRVAHRPRHAGDGLGAAGLKKLELAKALATGRSSCWPTRAWAGWTSARWSRRPTCCAASRSDLGITIIWVEHIMGVLMRVVDRVMVLDHGEKIAEGLPAQVATRSARDRGLSRHPAAAAAPSRPTARDRSRMLRAAAPSTPATAASRRCSTSPSR